MGHYPDNEIVDEIFRVRDEARKREKDLEQRGYSAPLRVAGRGGIYPGYSDKSEARACMDCGVAVANPDKHDQFCPAKTGSKD